jgi:hypothetical protein
VTSPSPLSPWRAAELVERSEETPRGANLVFAIDGWRGHRAGQHVDLRLTGEDGYHSTIRRSDGRLQVTLAGHPLYDYVGDRHPHQVLCQGVIEFGGGWFVVAPNGHVIR